MGSVPSGLSASRAAVALGLSPWATPVDLWVSLCEERRPGFCSAHGIAPPAQVDTAAVRWGSAFEGQVIRLAERSRGQSIESREMPLSAMIDGVPCTCHLDGIYDDGMLHEGKTASLFAFRDKWGEPGTDRIPREYQVQVQHQMMLAAQCAGHQLAGESAIVSVLVWPMRCEDFEATGTFADPSHLTTGQETCVILGPTTRAAWADVLQQMGLFYQYEISAAPAAWQAMAEGYREFWRHVESETPPPAQAWGDVTRLIVDPKGTLIATDDQARLFAEYQQLGKEAAAARKRQDQIKTLILAPVIDADMLPIDDESREKIIVRDTTGIKLGQYARDKNGKPSFRATGG